MNYSLLGSAALIALIITGNSWATEAIDERYYGNRIVVKMQAGEKAQPLSLTPDRLQKLAPQMASKLSPLKRLATGGEVLQVNAATTPEQLEALAAELRGRDGVEYAHVDYKRYPSAFPQSEPNDSFYSEQWYLQSKLRGAAHFNKAWPQLGGLTGSGVRIAVIDTGWTVHADQDNDNRIILGPDFVSSDKTGIFSTAGDGDGRDADGSDIGDLVTQSDKDNKLVFKNDPGCSVSADSSWHGTMVSGIIAASTDNGDANGSGVSIAGAAPGATVISVRALGKCGGYSSDITDAALWSASLGSSGSIAPIGQPVDIINLSLGGGGGCTQTEQEALQDIRDQGIIVITASGNEGGNASNSAPGSCDNTFNIAATTAAGGETSYTNTGSAIDLSAPGGDSCAGNVCNIISTGQLIDPAPDKVPDTEADDGENWWRNPSSPDPSVLFKIQGTSFAAPLVASAAALLLEADPNLSPDRTLALLKDCAKTFPDTPADGTSACDYSRCGGGILDISASLESLESGVACEANFSDSCSGNINQLFDERCGEGTSSGGGGSAALWLPLLLLLKGALSLVGTRRQRSR